MTILSNNDEPTTQEIEVQQSAEPSSSTQPNSWPTLPSWAKNQADRKKWGSRLNITEWDEDEQEDSTYRLSNGWKGSDLVHSKTSPVRVLEYRLSFFQQNRNQSTVIPRATTADAHGNGNAGINTDIGAATLTGIVHFTSRAESHKGYCHGGSMCSVMDDCIGWTGFCASGTCIPWSGFTVQVNTKLCKPIKTGSILKVICRITKMERRKVWVKALLIDPTFALAVEALDDGDNSTEEDVDIDCGSKTIDELRSTLKSCIHAEGEGLIILNKGVIN